MLRSAASTSAPVFWMRSTSSRARRTSSSSLCSAAACAASRSSVARLAIAAATASSRSPRFTDRSRQVLLNIFRIVDQPLKSLPFHPRLVHAHRGDLEHTSLCGLFRALVRVRFVASCLGGSEHRGKQWILCHRLQRSRDQFPSGAAQITLQAALKDGGHVRLRGKQRGREEARRKAFAATRAARLRDAPSQEITEPPVDFSRALDVVEVHAVFRLLQQCGAAFSEFLPDSPDSLRLRLEGDFDHRIAATGPRHIFVDVGRGVRQQQCQSDSLCQRRLAEVVWAVQHVEARTELDIRVRDRRKISDMKSMEPQRARPAGTSWLCRSLYKCASARVARDFSASSLASSIMWSRRAMVSLSTGGKSSGKIPPEPGCKFRFVRSTSRTPARPWVASVP